jgi:hypothetical protein
VKVLLALLLVVPVAQAAPFGASPVQVPFLSYTGKHTTATIPPVTTQPLSYAGALSPALPPVNVSALSYQGRGDPKGIPSVNAPTLSYKGKQ